MILEGTEIRGETIMDGNVFVKKLRLIPLTDKEILAVIEAVNTTCNECWEVDTESSYCTCMADE